MVPILPIGLFSQSILPYEEGKIFFSFFIIFFPSRKKIFLLAELEEERSVNLLRKIVSTISGNCPPFRKNDLGKVTR